MQKRFFNLFLHYFFQRRAAHRQNPGVQGPAGPGGDPGSAAARGLRRRAGGHGEAHEAENLAHPLAAVLGQVVVDGDDVDALARQGVATSPTAPTTRWASTTCGTTWPSTPGSWSSGATASPSWTAVLDDVVDIPPHDAVGLDGLVDVVGFGAIYKLDIVEIPTNRPLARVDDHDVVYKTEAAKYRAVIEQIKACHAKGQPVLVGTVSIEKNEHLSKLLAKEAMA